MSDKGEADDYDDCRGREPASDALVELVRKHGRTVLFAEPGSDEERYLDVMGAEANVGGPDMTHILVRPNPSKAALLEEFLHGTQWRLGIIADIGIDRAEIAVKDFMIRFQGLLGISAEDVALLERLIGDDEPPPGFDIGGFDTGGFGL